MKAPQLFSCLGLAIAVLLGAGQAKALQPGSGDQYKTPDKADDPNYKYHEAGTLSGIDLQPIKKDGTFLLKFDQQLSENGTLEIKDARGKIWYTNVIGVSKDALSRTMNVGKLVPGIYSIQVKTAGTTFWKKVRIRK